MRIAKRFFGGGGGDLYLRSEARILKEQLGLKLDCVTLIVSK